MTKGRKSKSVNELRDESAARAASLIRANSVQVYERLVGRAHKEDILGKVWRVERDFVVADGWSVQLTDQQKESWPTLNFPETSMLPGVGYSTSAAPARGSVVLMVAAFNVSGARLVRILNQTREWQEADPHYRPLFLTNFPDHKAFRHSGYNFEYFPEHIYCGARQMRLFVERFQMLRRKWNAASFLDLGVPSFLRKRLGEDYEKLLQVEPGARRAYSPRLQAPKPKPAAIADIAALRAEYLGKGLHEQNDSFALFRIIGNDLPPRHKPGQTLENLNFVLEHEPDLEDCDKHWIVNRIVDPERQKEITELLDERRQRYTVLPFELDEYSHAQWKLSGFPDPGFLLGDRFANMSDYDRLRAEAHVRTYKSLYAINNNGARNLALRSGRVLAKWVLPWDGNCFLTEQAWGEIRAAIKDTPYMKYIAVPMARMGNNQLLLKDREVPPATEEPQIIFRCDAEEEFDECLSYGRRPKVDLLWRLGIPGVWDIWADDVWDTPRSKRSEDAGAFREAGWVARLGSGREELEAETQESRVNRAIARSEGLIGLLDGLDRKAVSRRLNPARLTIYCLDSIGSLQRAPRGTNMAIVYDRLLQEAELAMQRGPYSVLDKSAVPPSGDMRDYYNPATFWWPDAHSEDGMLGQWREGKRAPGSEMYSKESDSYDRTRLQHVFVDATVLALAGCASQNFAYSAHAAALVREWFLNPETAMNPHLRFAQFKPGNDADDGSARGVVEMKDMYFFLDAVRLLTKAGVLSEVEDKLFRVWLKEYLEWLTTSEQGLVASRCRDYQGTCYDLQVGAIAAFLGDSERIVETMRRCRTRIAAQFGQHGYQKYEIRKVQSAHFCALNLQSWMHLANLASTFGDDLWGCGTDEERSLALGVNWMLSKSRNGKWPYRQDFMFDEDRLLPLTLIANAQVAGADSVALAMHCLRKPFFHPNDGVFPFWMLSAGVREAGGGGPQNIVARIKRRTGAIASTGVEDAALALKPKDLEERLWGGYSDVAFDALKRIAEDRGASSRDRENAAWMQARWCSSFGRTDNALAALTQIDQERRAERKDYLLLEADCLVRAGRHEEARKIVLSGLASRPEDASLTFAVANSHLKQKGLSQKKADKMRLSWLNKVYYGHGLCPLELRDKRKSLSFFNIQGESPPPATIDAEVQPKISVIIPVYNGAETIPVALRSLQDQTWKNLEILVSDDCSTDKTCEVVREFARTDRRIKLIRGRKNGGAYVARNAGLRRSTGEFFTVHDADDWSHPQKIEIQVRDLLRRGNSSGVVTVWGRVDRDLYALNNWRPMPTLFSTNHSSLMLSRSAIVQIGPWDRVRIGADMEFLRRFEAHFGMNKINTVHSKVPLSLSLERSEALTRAEATHVRTIYHGVRLDYRRNYLRWQSNLDDKEVAGLLAKRKRAFPAPHIMLPNRKSCPAYAKIFVADFSLSAPAIEAVAELVTLTAIHAKGVGVLNWPDYDSGLKRKMHPTVENLIDEFRVDLISAYQKAKTDTLVLCDPFLARYPFDGLSELQIGEVAVLCREASSKEVVFDRRRRRMPTSHELEQMFGAPCRWQPISSWQP